MVVAQVSALKKEASVLVKDIEGFGEKSFFCGRFDPTVTWVSPLKEGGVGVRTLLGAGKAARRKQM